MEIKLTEDTKIGDRLYRKGDNVTVTDSYGYTLLGKSAIRITQSTTSEEGFSYMPIGW